MGGSNMLQTVYFSYEKPLRQDEAKNYHTRGFNSFAQAWNTSEWCSRHEAVYFSFVAGVKYANSYLS